MRLYCAPKTISVAVYIALHEAGLTFDVTTLDFGAGEQTQAPYLEINPKGRVPTLELADGQRLTETGAILELVAALAPDAGLMPEDALAAARVRSVMYYLASTAHVNHAHARRGARWADRPESHADMAAKVPQTMTQSARFIEAHCLGGDPLGGETPCVADFYAFMICSWMEGDGVAIDDFPGITAFLERMRARPSVRAAYDAGLL
ncbi:glutathione S-transferase family protein [Sulfitobacter sp. D35]|uniref:glutathione S-transferase family protein n=1 Tax=Sulfitobacter sp. D35 TaxID=3083252 RepID=UPI00296E97CE|nr:glutathione S-transferase family protein [Sulfitobacter sp. D35]MDW4500101.1 glutathione S-transferase family protein [Sulfitobacter sp. D35]